MKIRPTAAANRKPLADVINRADFASAENPVVWGEVVSVAYFFCWRLLYQSHSALLFPI